jgi:hypothetical protein
MAELQFRWTSSLDKVFLNGEHPFTDYNCASALQGEIFSLQLAYKSDILLNPCEITLLSPLSEVASIRQVYSMPAASFGEMQDDYIIDNKAGLYPDLLSSPSRYRSAVGLWHSVWITLRLKKDTLPGEYKLKLQFKHRNHYRKDRNFEIETPEFTLNVLPVQLPQARCKVTEWFYGDCLYRQYGVEPWSEEFFTLCRNYFCNMRSHGINMIYTPLFTPPLDTHVGYERPTFQSVKVFEDAEGCWRFDLSNLERYLLLAEECGMDYFEFSHLFTQWGAEFTPKIMVTLPDGSSVRRFGWDVRANSELYQKFLKVLMVEVNKLLEKHNWSGKSYFHISDEPYEENLEAYKQASELFHRSLPGCRFIDALSRPEFFTNGYVDIPVPANNHIEEFTGLDLPERWTYYCVSQWNKVPNQFAHFPSARNRILGLLLYVYDLDGFLHWGYNFWFGQLSTFEIDPYRDICAGNGFPPGDAFKVYPGKDGMPEDSIRHEVFFEGLQDLAALQLLESRIGREKVLEFIADMCGGNLPKMDDYPHGAEFLLNFHNRLNSELAKCLNYVE